MRELNKKNVKKRIFTEKIIQFGEGNFLRAFFDWIIWNIDNKTDFNGSIVMIPPTPRGNADRFNIQDSLFHVNTQGIENNKAQNNFDLIDCVSRTINCYNNFEEYIKLSESPDIRFVVSNTTESGIVFDETCRLKDKPAMSYPGKLTQLLFNRYKFFNGDKSKGLIILPCELILHNGKVLKNIIYKYIKLWKLPEDFKLWFEESCHIYSTLVDRIVTGFPKKEIKNIQKTLDFNDNLVAQAEIYHLWIIQAPQSLKEEIPLDIEGINIKIVPDESLYHLRKITLLNGPHTVLSPVSFLSGIDIVRDACQDSVISKYIHKVMFEELMPSLDMPKDELVQFANDVITRFKNPYIDHAVTSIMLNSFSKFKTRDLPSLKNFYNKNKSLPKGLVLGLAAIIIYYKGGKREDGTIYEASDSFEIISFIKNCFNEEIETSAKVKKILSATFIWNEDLNKINGLCDLLTNFVDSISKQGMSNTIKTIL